MPTQRNGWIDYWGTSKKSLHSFRASKYNPYVCDHCGHRTTRYSNMITHLERVHHDYTTDPRDKAIAIQEGIADILRKWKAF